MATRLKRQLNDRQVKNAKPQPKTYRLLDGDGLFRVYTKERGTGTNPDSLNKKPWSILTR